MIGRTLAHYEITGHLGTGGMGEVYEAIDSRLGRSVAIKFLPEAFAHDAERVARFQREARVLAALNHPNIASIHGLEEGGGRRFLVMELVPGETLAERIHRGPIPVDEALAIAQQIVDALDSAHEKGVVHRDLKPANIKITPEGTVKVLDFGLAKAYEPESGSSLSLANSPTISHPATQQGVILGTAAYMSPEQARGKAVDRRADIWAFGVIVFEMVTGGRLFEGETVSDTLAAVLERNLRIDQAPAKVRPLLKSCLERDPRKRLRDIGDAWRLLDTVTDGVTADTVPVRRSSWLLPAALTVLLVAALVPASLYFLKSPEEPPVMRFESQAAGTEPPIISPDGQRIAYTAPQNGKNVIWVRPIGSLTTKPLAGTENVEGTPFWAPDGHQLGFVSEGKLRKVDVNSGGVQVLYEGVIIPLGGAWNSAGDILFPSFGDQGPAIMRVTSSGGTPVPASPPLKTGEGIAIFPQFLPDGRQFIFHVVPNPGATSKVLVGSLDAKTATPLTEVPNFSPTGNSYVRYVAPGYLLFSRDRTLFAQRFDLQQLATAGDPASVAENVMYFSASDQGTLVYRNPGASASASEVPRLLWFDRRGKAAGEVSTPAPVGSVELSRDGQSIVIDTNRQQQSDVWVIDARGVPHPVTNTPAFEGYPIWNPSGTDIVYAANRTTGAFGANLFRKASNAVGTEEPLFPAPNRFAMPRDWSLDGKTIVFDLVNTSGMNNVDIWILPMSGEKKPFPFLETAAIETQGQISPDGQYIAFATNESGRYQIVVRTFPDPNKGKWTITSAGGVEPRWRRKDGAELYYLSLDGKIMAVPITRGSTFGPGAPMELFAAPPLGASARPVYRRYDVTADGQRFIFAALFAPPAVETSSQPIITVVNWTRALKQK